MKLIVYLTLLVILVNGCEETSSRLLSDKWIEKDNYTNPLIIEFSEDYFSTNSRNNQDERLYKIKGNTLMVQGDFELIKMKFNITNDLLELHSSDSNSSSTILERFNGKTLLEFFNKKLNTSISLPENSADNLDLSSVTNAFFSEYDKDQELKIYRNGKLYNISDSSFMNLLPHSYDLWMNNYTALYCDKNLKIRDVNLIKEELKKGHLLKILCITKNSQNKLNSVRISLPYSNSHLPKSVTNKYLLPPPPPEFMVENWNLSDLLCKVHKGGIVANNDSLSEIEFQSLVKYRMNQKGFIIHLYFDENLLYENYLNRMYNIKNIYYSARNKFSEEKFGIANYKDLDKEDFREVVRKYPMWIREINKDEHEIIKTLYNKSNK